VRRTLAALAAVVACAAGLTACSDDDVPGPGPSDVAVDTPELREQKAAAGIEDCVPGPGGGGLPSLELPCLGGGPSVDLASLTGPLVINIWNTACGPCRKEMPALQQFHEQYGDQVALIGLDTTDTQPDQAIRFADMVGATYPQIADPGGEIFELEELRLTPAFPQFLFLDADGQLVSRYASGKIETLEQVVELVEDQMGLTL
jgi:thiol-disulfide isomerase/thioredoxin